MIDGVIFDKDGTLFDFGKAGRVGGQVSAWNRRGPGPCPRDGPCHRLRSGPPRVLAAKPGDAATAADIALALSPHLPDRKPSGHHCHINAAAAQATMSEAVPLRPLLETLRGRGLRIGLATNDTEAPARAHLAAHGITDLFDFIAGYDSGHGPKPGPGMCLAFARSLGLSPARVAMWGDSLHDLHAGRRAGG